MKYFIKIIFLFLIFKTNFLFAEIVKPNNGIEPYQVVKIQLRGLKNNDKPYDNAGIEQTWEFAHPNNKKITGPLENFKLLLKSDSYKMLLNHIDHQVQEVNITDEKAAFEVTVLGEGKTYYKFRWIVERYDREGPLKDCWLTTMVSSPEPLGKSI